MNVAVHIFAPGSYSLTVPSHFPSPGKFFQNVVVPQIPDGSVISLAGSNRLKRSRARGISIPESCNLSSRLMFGEARCFCVSTWVVLKISPCSLCAKTSPRSLIMMMLGVPPLSRGPVFNDTIGVHTLRCGAVSASKFGIQITFFSFTSLSHGGIVMPGGGFSSSLGSILSAA